MLKKKQWSEWAWDAWCIASCIGIWPRYIEPNLLNITRLTLPIPHLSTELSGLKILQFSDLHWSSQFPEGLKKKLIKKVNHLNPDLIFFTGDFICRSKMEDPRGLIDLLNTLQATMGCFAILGNHDYSQFVTVNAQGDYDVDADSSEAVVSKGFKRLFSSVALTKRITPEVRQIGLHEELISTINQTQFKLLANETRLVSCKGSWINICGLEEYITGRFNPEKAFKGYDEQHPGIVLSHNPDAILSLETWPGDVILSGHTHGGQVNLPFLWKRFACMEYDQFKSGLKRLNSKWAYINRGIFSVMKFRWFASPELTFITLQKG